jgi:hypothetical protein
MVNRSRKWENKQKRKQCDRTLKKYIKTLFSMNILSQEEQNKIKKMMI